MPKTFRPLAAPGALWGNTVTDLAEIDDNPKRWAVDLMRICLASRVPVMLWGPPGASKTETIRSLSRFHDEEGAAYRVAILQPSTEDPTTLFGLKAIETDPGGRVLTIRTMPDVVQAIIDDYGGVTSPCYCSTR